MRVLMEAVLEPLIPYAEIQARLQQSLGDNGPWLLRVCPWANLQRASNAIEFPTDDELESQLITKSNVKSTC